VFLKICFGAFCFAIVSPEMANFTSDGIIQERVTAWRNHQGNQDHKKVQGLSERRSFFIWSKQMQDYYFLTKNNPEIIIIAQTATKRKKRNFAISAAPWAIPVNPKSAAMIASTKNKNDQRSIVFDFLKWIFKF
jgi:hypothetical protein